MTDYSFNGHIYAYGFLKFMKSQGYQIENDQRIFSLLSER